MKNSGNYRCSSARLVYFCICHAGVTATISSASAQSSKPVSAFLRAAAQRVTRWWKGSPSSRAAFRELPTAPISGLIPRQISRYRKKEVMSDKAQPEASPELLKRAHGLPAPLSGNSGLRRRVLVLTLALLAISMRTCRLSPPRRESQLRVFAPQTTSRAAG